MFPICSNQTHKEAEFTRHQFGYVEGHFNFTSSFTIYFIYICLFMYQRVPATQDVWSSHHLMSNRDPLLQLWSGHKWRSSEAQFLSSAFDSGWCLWLWHVIGEPSWLISVGRNKLNCIQTRCIQQKMNMELTTWDKKSAFAWIHVSLWHADPQVLPAPSCGSLSGCQSPKARKIKL